MGTLPAEALRELFHGPDRVLHLREDAAEELHERTGGLPGRVAAELNGWVGARLCAWEEGRLRIRRAELDQLRGGLLVGPAGGWSYAEPAGLDESSAELLGWIVLGAGALDASSLAVASVGQPWEISVLLDDLLSRGFVRQRRDGRLDALVAPPQLQALGEEEVLRRHRAIANALPRGTEARLRQWMLVGEAEAVAGEALEVARGLREVGSVSVAFGLLLSAIPMVRARVERALETRLLEELTLTALETRQPEHRSLARGTIAASGGGGVEPLAALLDAYSTSMDKNIRGAAAKAEGLAPFSQPDIEAARLGLVVRAANEFEPARAEKILAGLAEHTEPVLRARHRAWLGLLRYEQERFAEAAELHAEAGRLDPRPARRLVALLNEGSARLDAGQLGEARTVLEALACEGARQRHVASELWAFGLLRSVAYRSGVDTPPDEEWIAMSRELGEVRRHAHACLVEAAGAWRLGMTERARALALESAEAFERAGQPGFAVLPMALACRCGAPFIGEVRTRVRGTRLSRVTMQSLVLARLVGDITFHETMMISKSRAAEFSDFPDGRMDVLSRDELAGEFVGPVG